MNFKIPASPQTLKTISRLDELRDQWSRGARLPDDHLRALEEASLVRSVAASCRLSGIRVSDAEVIGLLRGESLAPRDADAVRGYAAAMRHPFPSSSELLTARQIREMHSVLEDHAGISQSPWRHEVSQREAFDAEGRAIGRVFGTLPPRLVPQAVDDLLTWTEYELRAREQHPLAVIAVFVLGLIAASPFQQKNGRLSRVLIGRMLERAGYGYARYASIEAQFEGLRDRYHDAFDLAQTRFWTGEGDLEPWLGFFFEMLDRHRERVAIKMELEREIAEFPPLQRSILETVREHGTVDAALLIRATGANRNTLKDNLRKLVQRGALERTGQKRGTRYSLPALDSPRGAVSQA